MPLRAQKPVSKLATVLNGLGVTRIEHKFDGSAVESIEDKSASPTLRPVLKLHQPQDETAVEFSDTKQLQQMGRHLIRWRTELENQQDQLRSEQYHWTRQMQLEHERIADCNAELDQRQRQTKAIEFQVMQLQNDVIDAQVALEKTVTALTECTRLENQKHDRDSRTIAELQTLKFEINERFDYLEKRWKNLRAESFPAS